MQSHICESAFFIIQSRIIIQFCGMCYKRKTFPGAVTDISFVLKLLCQAKHSYDLIYSVRDRAHSCG